MLILVWMALTLMQGHTSGSTQAKMSFELSRHLSKQSVLSLLCCTTVGHVLRDLDFETV